MCKIINFGGEKLTKKNFISGYFLILFLILALFCMGAEKINIAMSKMNEALSQMSQRKYSSALKNFLYLFDNAHKYEPEFMDIKNSFLIIYLKKMLKKYPPTKKSLVYRYLEMKKKAESGKCFRYEIDTIYKIAKLLNRKDELIDVYDIAKMKIKDKTDLNFLTKIFYPLLYSKKRYRDIYTGLDVIKEANELTDKNKTDNKMLVKFLNEKIIKRLNEYVVILVSVKDIRGEKTIRKLIETVKTN